jgi:dTDP-glucose pyrophosphorylase
MNFVIPMAGQGSRFAKAGFQLPKMLIEAHGKSLLRWSIDSLPLELCTKMICILLASHEEEHSLSQTIKNSYQNKGFNIEFIILPNTTSGQAETVYMAKETFDITKQLIIFNIDTAFEAPHLGDFIRQNKSDGILCSFNSNKPNYSYAQTNSDGYITRTAEKEVISQHALNGLYHFNFVNDFIETYEFHKTNKLTYNGEYYIAPMYNYLIEKGRNFTVFEVDKNYILGTPEELKLFNPYE